MSETSRVCRSCGMHEDTYLTKTEGSAVACFHHFTARTDEPKGDKPAYQVRDEAFAQCMDRLGIDKNLGHACDLEPLWDAGYLRGVSECEEKYRSQLQAERTRREAAEGDLAQAKVLLAYSKHRHCPCTESDRCNLNCNHGLGIMSGICEWCSAEYHKALAQDYAESETQAQTERTSP